MARGPDLSKQRYWLDLISRWQRSDVTVRDFCDRNGVSEASFFAWRRVLRERGLLSEDDDAAPTGVGVPGGPRFVPVVVAGADSAGACLEVVLGDGLCVRVPVGFDADTLAQLLDVLRRRPC
jgi:hypothetical protein